MPQYYLKTFGCQMNEHDSRKIGAMLQAQGYAATDDMAQADLILFNTCTIRHKAQQKAVSDIGRTARLKAQRPNVIVGVCGCVAQQEQEALFKRFPHVDLLFGPDRIPRLPQLLATVTEERRQVSALELINTPAEYEFMNLVPWAETASEPTQPTAYVTIMKGCDQHCSYCIVPKVRGREVCRPADDILGEIRALVARGVREVTLLGQTVNTYGGRRHAETPPFPELLQRIADETDIARIRFTSPHPKDLNAALIAAYVENPKLCPHMHLPLQAGCDRTLQRMRRAYSCAQYLAKVEALRAAVPEIAITTDMIVGFPGETAADFAESLAVVEAVQFDGMYAFAYSPRPGTESFARLPDDVAPDEKEARLAALLGLQAGILRRTLETLIGTRHEVLIERYHPATGQCSGRMPRHHLVHSAGEAAMVGQLLPVRITKAFGNSLGGEICESRTRPSKSEEYHRECHPEAKPKDLACIITDPSLRSG